MTDALLPEDEAAELHRLRAIVRSAGNFGVVATDLDGRVIQWNPGAESIFGWTEAEIRGRPADLIFTPEDHAIDRVGTEMRLARDTGRANDERWHIRKDGSRFWASGEMMPLRTEAGQHIGYVKILRDRTAEHDAGLALTRSEESLRRAQDAGGLGIFTLDLVTGTLYPTSQFCSLYGLPPTPAIAADAVAELVVLDDAARLLTSTAIASGTAIPVAQYRIQRADTDALRWIERRGEFEAGPDGKPVRFVGVVRDITEERLARNALVVREERFRALFDTIDDGFCIIELVFDGNGRCTDYRHVEANLAFERHTGLSNVTGAFMRDLAPTLDRRWFDTYAEVARTGQPVRFEDRVHTADRFFDVRAARLGGEGSHLVAVLLADVTERRAMEEQLRLLNLSLEQQVRERTAEFQRVWNSTNDLMGTFALTGHLVSLNPAWSRLLGWSRDELLSRPVLDFIDPADHRAAEAVIDRLAAGATEFVARMLQKTGGARIIDWQLIRDGEVAYVVGRDITDQTRAEDQLRQSQKMEAVGQLTGGIAHDFNNLLTGISGSLELLGNRVAQGRVEGMARYIEAAQQSARRAAALTHRLLAFSRRQTLEPRVTDVDDLVSGMEELVDRTVGPAIVVTVRRTPGLWTTLVDPNQLESALLNLCINARDAMPGGGTLLVSTGNQTVEETEADAETPPGDYVTLSVRDDGVGMSADVAARAFEPFFTTKPLGQGTGLGLSMIYGFARQSGGGVRIASTKGHGSTVTIRLPRGAGMVPASAPEGAATRLPASPPSATVLVVDDEPTVRMLVTDVLDELGLTRLEAECGASGLALLQSDARIDLLITDVGLPGGMNGRQMADAARVTRPGLPVLFITGFADNAIGNAELAPGMRVLSKPFPMESLTQRINELLTA